VPAARAKAPKVELDDAALLRAIEERIAGEAWRRGDLQFKYHVTQKRMDAAIHTALERKQRRFCLLCSRRQGKSHYLVARGIETAIQKPNQRILYLAPWAKDAASIASDLAAKVLADCPEDLRPTYNSQDKEFRFPNGSIIRLKGTNGEHAQFLRGGEAHLIILDECALMDDLRAVLNDVCLPMTATTKGLILLATTPPKTPSHEFTNIYEELAGEGATVMFTLRDAPHLDDDEKRFLLRSVGENPERITGILDGTLEPETTTARREFFCEFVTDADSAVVPEFTFQARQEIVREVERPDYFDAYVAMDPGMRDRTGILFAYWDFLECKLVIEDELLLHHAITDTIARAIKEKEGKLWGLRNVARVSDVDLRLIADLALPKNGGLKFVKAQKVDSMAAINLMRMDVQDRTLVIHPRCVNLIRQLQNAVWNKKGTDFLRPSDPMSIEGHYDLVAALKYMCRSISRKKNPYPQHFYDRGGKFGPRVNEWVSPKRSGQKKLGLFPDTPLGRRMAGLKKKPN
jgi:hypothetical protein